MKEFIEYIIKHLVDKPEQVKVTVVEGNSTMVYQLQVGAGDVGKVIGKQGHTVKSIRILLSAVSAKSGKRAVLEIFD